MSENTRPETAEKGLPSCTCDPARIDGYLIHRQDCARSVTKREERCPNDGQTLAWHEHAELGPDGNPRTNAEFIGCHWPENMQAGIKADIERQARAAVVATRPLPPDPGCSACGAPRWRETALCEQCAHDAGLPCPDCGHQHTPDGCVDAGSPVVCDCGVWDGETEWPCVCGHFEHQHDREADLCMVCGDSDRCVTSPGAQS